MYVRKNLDFSPNKEDFQIKEIDIGVKINGETLGGAYKTFNEGSNLHIEFENEKELHYVINFLHLIYSDLQLRKSGFYNKAPFLYPFLTKIN